MSKLKRPPSYCICGRKLGERPAGMGYREWEAKHKKHFKACKIMAGYRRMFEDGILPHTLEHMEHGARKWPPLKWTEKGALVYVTDN